MSYGKYGKCRKILITKVAEETASANSADTDQEQSDQGIHYLLFHLVV